MDRTLISKRDLDALIRLHLTNSGGPCDQVSPMPIVWRARRNGDCNWAIPGWAGDSETVRLCVDRLNGHLRELRRSYDIPDEQ